MAQRPAERYLTTVLFTDIVGSTELAAELGDRGWKDLVEQHHAVVRAALRRHGGREIDTAGDGFFATFDAPGRAVECALEVSGAVRALGLDIRAGVHVGEVQQVGQKVGGIAVPIGARIMAAAAPGEVLVSATVRDLAAGSGHRFEDRGVRDLKGVPGEWRLYAVTRPGADTTGSAVDTVPPPDRAARRAAAVRRARSRPWWRRHPVASTVAVGGLAVVVVAAALLAWSPWRVPALPGVAENAVGIIDPSRNEIVGAVNVGAQPGGLAAGEGSLWVTNTGANTVARIDLSTRSVVDTIDVGEEPIGIAVAGGSVWVANSGSRSVSRVNAATGRVVDTIEVGNGPRSLAVADGFVWVANGSDGTVVRIDAASATPDAPVAVGSLPGALLLHEGALWVASEDGGTVSRHDPVSGLAGVPPIPVGARPTAMAGAPGSVWVANAADGTVSRIDTASNRVVSVIDVGGTPVALAVSGDTLWVGDATGGVERIDTSQQSVAPSRVATGSAPHAIAVVDGVLWIAARALPSSHRGGTLRAVSQYPPIIDRVTFSYPELLGLTGDGLVGYARIGGIGGTRIVPALASSVPRPTDGGRTYTFQLRPGLVYSDGEPVMASHIKGGVHRSFEVADPDLGASAAYYWPGLRGVEPCLEAPGEPCDLSQAVVVDDARGTIAFHLQEPDPDFLYKLASPFSPAFPVPPGVLPADATATNPYPVTGPYQFASVTDDTVRLTRNPRFSSWDPANRPEGFVDEIVWTWGIEPPEQVRMVQAGEADYMAEGISPDAVPTLQREYTPQLQRGLATTTFAFLNTKIPPFDRLDVRKAVAFAVDRAGILDARGGPGVAAVTCQVLPPNFPGYEPYCPYTIDSDPGGHWTGPDLAEARRLVDASGTAGAKVVVGPFPSRMTAVGAHLTDVLRDLGYEAIHEVPSSEEEVGTAVWEEGRVAIGGFEWIADFPAPYTFLAGFTCEESDGLSNYCDPELDALVEEARSLQTIDPAAAVRKWAEVDRTVTDLVLWVPLVNEGSDFVSARVENYQFNVAYSVLLDQVWLR